MAAYHDPNWIRGFTIPTPEEYAKRLAREKRVREVALKQMTDLGLTEISFDEVERQIDEMDAQKS